MKITYNDKLNLLENIKNNDLSKEGNYTQKEKEIFALITDDILNLKCKKVIHDIFNN